MKRCKNCGHEIFGRRTNIGCGEIEMIYKHKNGGNYCKILNYSENFYGKECMCSNAEPLIVKEKGK